ncbi:hypothetical protein B0T20DRAFT_477514 [Sordaria brevicollis]|uniref:Uncharacterized protein n=1 Tax=Sordaria brevicollis TaxID=83679 RepID=A0AAE0PHN5_SORBR|nr:hypothetical protein B0T20DRAFT_477514 [Sordaria brevicollis]
MSANNTAPRARRFRSLEEYWSAKLANTTSAQPGQPGYQDNTFPTTTEGLLGLVDEVIAAFKNENDIIETTENNQVRFIRGLTYEDAELGPPNICSSKVETQKAQVEGSSHPGVVTAEFPDFITRWKFVVAYFKTSKAAVYNIFRPSFMERFVNNPATELDMKLSNKSSNGLKKNNEHLAQLVKSKGVASYDKATGELKDAQGTLLKKYEQPGRRRIADVVSPDLIKHAKVKRGSRQPAAASANTQPGDNQEHAAIVNGLQAEDGNHQPNAPANRQLNSDYEDDGNQNVNDGHGHHGEHQNSSPTNHNVNEHNNNSGYGGQSHGNGGHSEYGNHDLNGYNAHNSNGAYGSLGHANSSYSDHNSQVNSFNYNGHSGNDAQQSIMPRTINSNQNTNALFPYSHFYNHGNQEDPNQGYLYDYYMQDGVFYGPNP